MAEKFDPAPTDKHADTPKERAIGDKKADDELKPVCPCGNLSFHRFSHLHILFGS